MSSLKLSARLRALANYVPRGGVLADIGSDHAHIPLALLQEGRIDGAIASDILPDPMNNARALGQALGISEDSCSFRCGDGLTVLEEGEADYLLMSGMGAELMIGILASNSDLLDSFSRLILSPHSKPWLLRAWLLERGFALRDESLIRERKRFYEIHIYELGLQTLKPHAIYFGPYLLAQANQNVVQEYFQRRCEQDRAMIDARLAANKPTSPSAREARKIEAHWRRKEEDDALS